MSCSFRADHLPTKTDTETQTPQPLQDAGSWLINNYDKYTLDNLNLPNKIYELYDMCSILNKELDFHLEKFYSILEDVDGLMILVSPFA